MCLNQIPAMCSDAPVEKESSPEYCEICGKEAFELIAIPDEECDALNGCLTCFMKEQDRENGNVYLPKSA